MTSVIHDHLKHLAHIHIEKEDAIKAAKALDSVPEVAALEYLFSLANLYRTKNMLEKSQVALDAATIYKNQRTIS